MALDRLRHLRFKPVNRPIDRVKSNIKHWHEERERKGLEKLKADNEKLEEKAEKERERTQQLEKKHDKQIELTSLKKRQEFAKRGTKKRRSKVNEVQLAVNEIRKFQRAPPPRPQQVHRTIVDMIKVDNNFGVNLNVSSSQTGKGSSIADLASHHRRMLDFTRW